MKRFRLPTKLALAIAPIGLVALAAGAWLSWSSLEEARVQERASYAAEVASDAMDALVAVSSERSTFLQAAVGDSGGNLDARRSASDRAIERLQESVAELVPRASGPASGIAGAIVSHSSLSEARLENARSGDPLSDENQELFDEVGNRLITIASQATLYLNEPGPAREGEGAVSLARASFASFQQEQLLVRFDAGGIDIPEEEFEQRFAALESNVVDWLSNADDNSPTIRMEGFVRTQVSEDGSVPDTETFLYDRNEVLAGAAAEILTRVANAADRAATTVRTEAATVAAVVLGVIFVTVVFALILGRSTVRRVRSVTTAAQNVADVELPRLVDALSNPKGKLADSVPPELEEGGPDEVGELAQSFRSLHSTLVEVANRQMEILRRGVSEIFVTLARRNGSLVDRQLALIDDLESRQEDPEILAGYYKLDHLATRMRRNAESLLVLAGSESPRMWSEPLDMGDVVRAALGEVDEYQRVDVLALEPARIQGRVVTDLAHLMSELLDNATQFSPPSERVRVTGLFDDEGYVLTIADSGLGMSEERMAEINRLIVDPPVLGLALEPTLGMYVVARLSSRHGIAVRLVPGVPGTTVRITLPRTLLEPSADETPRLEAPDPIEEVKAVEPPERREVPASSEETASDRPSRRREAPEPAADPKPEVAPPPAPEKKEEKEPEQPSVPSVAEPRSASIPSYAFRSGSHAKTEQDDAPKKSHQVSEPSRPVPRKETRERPPFQENPGRTSTAKPQPAPQRSEGDLPRRPTNRPASEAPSGQTSPPTPPPSARRTENRPAAPKPRPVDSERREAPPPSGPLPTRKPGSSFRGDVGDDGTSTVSKRGAEGIRNALDGYRLGRDIASSPPRSQTKEGTDQRPDEGGDQ